MGCLPVRLVVAVVVVLLLFACQTLAQTTTRREQEEREQRRKWRQRGGSRTWGTNSKDENLHAQHRAFNISEINGTKALQLLFPTRQPRHVAEGAVNLAKSVATGVTMGLVSLIAMPLAGLKKGGVAGLLLGGVAGSLFSAVFCVIGLANGAYQMARGAIETPSAIHAARNGMIWDTSTEQWRLYYLEDEWEELSSYSEYSDASRSVKDMTYYNLLDVPADAKPKAIKRAYYTKAKAVHPDKNVGNAEAAERFRQLHAAYLILQDDEKRAAYDKWGPSATDTGDAASDIPEFDPYLFFAILFGSQAVEPYIGELTVASFTDQVMRLHRMSNQPSPEDVVKLFWNSSGPGGGGIRSRKRQLEIALHLKNMVADYVSGKESKFDFRTRAREEAVLIATTPFGREYLNAIGTALVLEASLFLGFQQSILGWVRGAAFLVKKRATRIKSMVTIIRETIDVIKLLPRDDYDETSKIQVLKVLLPELLDVTWAYNTQDIGKTLHRACAKLFADASANSYYKRLERAEAVQILGEEFVAVADSMPERKTQPDHMARLEVAYQVAHMKATGMDIPEDPELMIKSGRFRGIFS